MMLRRKVLLLILFSAAILFWNAPTTAACSCIGPSNILDAYAGAKFVIVAQVISVEKADKTGRFVHDVMSTRLVVERVFKGHLKAGQLMTFGQGGGADCIWTFRESDIGERFLFYLWVDDRGEGTWRAGACTRSNNVRYTADDLLYLGKIEKVRGKTRLSGTLTFTQASSAEGEEPIYRPIDGARVLVVGQKKTYELTTNRDGVYEVYSLPGGEYLVEVGVPDGWKVNRPNKRDERPEAPPGRRAFRVVVQEGKLTQLDVEYGVNNALRGKVLSPGGDPMKGVCVDIIPAYATPSKYFREFNCTDRDGAFEISGVPPGSYLLVVNKDGKISSTEPFPAFYYPGVFEREKAGIISIGAGYSLDHLDIVAPLERETLVVQGQCLYSNGKPVVGGWVEFKADNTAEDIDSRARAQTDSDGRFSLRVLKGLKGSVYSEMFTYSGEFEDCPKIEELLRASGRSSTVLKTNTQSIRADDNVAGIEIRFQFPDCKKAKRKEPR